MTWELDVIGTPAPQGSKAYKGKTKEGKPILVESSKGVKPWRESVKLAAYAVRPPRPFDEPLWVVMVFTVRRPDGAPKRVRHPATQPDLSKLARATEDALTEAGVWNNDARVVEYIRLCKVYVGSGDPDALPVPGVRLGVYSEQEATGNEPPAAPVRHAVQLPL